MSKASKLVVCSVFDSKVGVYFQPFFARSRAEAIRSFTDATDNDGHVFSRHPEDFTLFVLAEWDEETGGFASLAAPASLGTALEHKSRKKDPPQLDLVDDVR